MAAVQVLIEGFLTAAELVALLFVSPVSAMESPRAERAVGTPAFERARELHLISTSFDVRLLGSLADVRVSQQFRNTGAEIVNLAGSLPAVDESTDALRIHRTGHIVDLLQLDSGCGSEGSDDEELQASTEGHAQLALDESIADALQLAPGETASIELIATQSLSLARTGTAYRLALPAHAAVDSQALLVDQGDVRFLVVVPHRAARGPAQLTLRPEGAASVTIDLGVSEPSIAYVIPLANRAALQALAAGAIELEARTHEGIVWSTLPTLVKTDASLALLTSK